MIFISYNQKDCGLIEELANRIEEIFGKDNIFYDKWSIQPGDGIIDKMNNGLSNCQFFLFFVSQNSLNSKMVKLEWQNALLKEIKGECKFIPIRISECDMPTILMQKLYIDIYTYGLETGLRQIIDVLNGNNTYRKENKFSNIKAYVQGNRNDSIMVEIQAEFYLEPISKFFFVFDNNEDELSFTFPESFTFQGFVKDGYTYNNKKYNIKSIDFARAITPIYPIELTIKALKERPIFLIDIMKGESNKLKDYHSIPLLNKNNI